MKVSTCKHGTKPTSQTLTCEGEDQFGRKKIETRQIEVLTCEQCKHEVLELLKDVPCDTCGDGVMQIHDEAWAKCDKCGHSCDLYQLEMISKRTEKSQIWHEIRECYLEDARRGSKGGGSGDKGPKKEDKLGSRSLRQVTWTDEDVKVMGQSKIEPKDAWLSVRGLPEGVSGEEVRKAIERKLGLWSCSEAEVKPAPDDGKICYWCGSTSDRHVIEGENRRCKACGALEGILDIEEFENPDK